MGKSRVYSAESDEKDTAVGRECVGVQVFLNGGYSDEGNKVGSLNTGNSDVGSDDINQAVDTREIISHVKPDLLSRLKSVAAGAA